MTLNKTRLDFRNIIIILFSILIFSAVILGILIAIPLYGIIDKNTIQESFVLEGAKYLMQLIVVIIIGGAIAALFKTFQHNMEARARDTQKEIEEKKLISQVCINYLARVGAAYRDVKETRRELRANGLTIKFECQPDILSDDQYIFYREKMNTLNKSQLEFEALQIEASSLPELFHLKELSSNLCSMEKYLRKITREFEETNARKMAKGKPIEFIELEELVEFTKSTDSGESKLRKKFSDPHRRVVKIISEATKPS